MMVNKYATMYIVYYCSSQCFVMRTAEFVTSTTDLTIVKWWMHLDPSHRRLVITTIYLSKTVW